MDLNLSLSYQEQNDNKAILLTDTSNFDDTGDTLNLGSSTVNGVLYQIVTQSSTDFTLVGAANNTPGTRFVWSGIPGVLGVGDSLIEVTGLPSEITIATLDTTITGVDQTPVSKSQVDLLAEFGPFLTQDDLVYTITAALLGDTPDSLLVDGLYELDYNIRIQVASGPPVDSTLNVVILVYGQVKVATYQKLRNIPVYYMCVDGCPSPEISEADLCGAYLAGIENSAYIAKTEELLNMLIVLDNIIKNGSNITW